MTDQERIKVVADHLLDFLQDDEPEDEVLVLAAACGVAAMALLNAIGMPLEGSLSYLASLADDERDQPPATYH